MRSIYMDTRKTCFRCSLQELTRSEWVRNTGSLSVFNRLCAGWLTEYAERDAAASKQVLCCTPKPKCPWHNPAMACPYFLVWIWGKVHVPNTYIIAIIAHTEL